MVRDAKGGHVALNLSDGDAVLIVQAANAHDAIVQALQKIAEPSSQLSSSDMRAIAIDALRNLGARP